MSREEWFTEAVRHLRALQKWVFTSFALLFIALGLDMAVHRLTSP